MNVLQGAERKTKNVASTLHKNLSRMLMAHALTHYLICIQEQKEVKKNTNIIKNAKVLNNNITQQRMPVYSNNCNSFT